MRKLSPSSRERLVRLASGAGLVATLGLAVFAVVYWYVELRHIESTDDAFVESTLLLLSARVNGNVIEVPVESHQRVRAGDVLVRLDPRDSEVRVNRARADLDAARNSMHAARASAAAAEAERRAASVELDRADKEAQRVQSLVESGAASEKVLETALAERDAAQARVRALVQRAIAERAVLGNEAPLRQAAAALAEAELELSYTTVVAPFDGVVGRKNVTSGQNVRAGQPLLMLAADERSWVVANFKETQIGRMRVGDPAEVRVDAFPEFVWIGHVESLSPATGAKYALIPPDNATGNFTKVVQRLSVKIVIDGRRPPLDGERDGIPGEIPGQLPIGLSVEVSVRVDGR